MKTKRRKGHVNYRIEIFVDTIPIFIFNNIELYFSIWFIRTLKSLLQAKAINF